MNKISSNIAMWLKYIFDASVFVMLMLNFFGFAHIPLAVIMAPFWIPSCLFYIISIIIGSFSKIHENTKEGLEKFNEALEEFCED